MPDLMSHLIIGLILAELFSVRKKSLVVLGAISPDVLSHLDIMYTYFDVPRILNFNSFHTPFMSFLISLLISAFFIYPKYKTILLFNLGSMSEYLSDLLVKHFTGAGTRFFFPFSLYNYSLSLVWSNDSIYILITCLVIYATIKLVKKKRK